MSCPVRPPTPDNALPAALDALLRALPAELVTLESPCCALLVACETLSFALFACWAAASEVEEAARLWRAHLDCWRASRGRELGGMVKECAMSGAPSQWIAVGSRKSLQIVRGWTELGSLSPGG